MSEPINWWIVASVMVPIVVGCLGVLGAVLGKRAQKGSREHALVDQYQDLLARGDARADKQDARVARLESRVTVVEKVSHIRLEYIYVLRRHIDAREPPPAPDWPAGIND